MILTSPCRARKFAYSAKSSASQWLALLLFEAAAPNRDEPCDGLAHQQHSIVFDIDEITTFCGTDVLFQSGCKAKHRLEEHVSAALRRGLYSVKHSTLLFVNTDFPTMITPDAARELALQIIAAGPTQTVAHADALGRILASDIVSTLDLPPFANSAMDGYAVRVADVADATQQTPVTLKLGETIGAGDVPQRKVIAGQCAKIMTGAPLPPGAEAVIMREETRESGGIVSFLAAAERDDNVRSAGSDVARGETVLRAGTCVRAAELAMLAALGYSHVEVYARPRVGIVTTGEELVGVEADLQAGQIRDSNGPALRALCVSAGATVVAERHVGDNPADLRAALDELAPVCDLILTSGGVSTGDFDPVRDVLLDDAKIVFWKVAMKPGKPMMVALYRETPVFALPGNPASVMVGWEEFARPALLKRAGARASRRLEVSAFLTENLRSAPDKTEFVRARVSSENGALIARVSGEQGSGRLSTMTRANALLVIEAGQTQLNAGTPVVARLLDCAEVE